MELHDEEDKLHSHRHFFGDENPEWRPLVDIFFLNVHTDSKDVRKSVAYVCMVLHRSDPERSINEALAS